MYRIKEKCSAFIFVDTAELLGSFVVGEISLSFSSAKHTVFVSFLRNTETFLVLLLCKTIFFPVGKAVGGDGIHQIFISIFLYISLMFVGIMIIRKFKTKIGILSAFLNDASYKKSLSRRKRNVFLKKNNSRVSLRRLAPRGTVNVKVAFETNFLVANLV